jgi:BirA family transcriptional regulator, biotin operon repressor / biotin---[acetyl-CoA-carboxylase] ligase
MQFIKQNIVVSTNSYASDLLISKVIDDEICVYALFQTKGRGLAKNVWESESGKNLLFSMIVFPEMKVEDYFKFNMIVSLSICRYLNLRGITAKIKWPNDIYVLDNKIAGILVENSFMGDMIQSSIVGVGLNLNQEKFNSTISNAISMRNITGIDYDIDDEIKKISFEISNGIQSLSKLSFIKIKENYLKNLYRYNIESLFKIGEKEILATIVDVKKEGHIVLNQSGEVKEYYFKELSLIS